MNSSLDENDFVTWEEDSDENNISYHKSSSPKEYDVCKCLGSIDGVECDTYYFVSSIKKHGGCAKRDCSNSFQNQGKLVFGRGTEETVEFKKNDSSLHILLAIIGIFFVFAGIASELGLLVAIGVICFIVILATSSRESTYYKYKKVTFRFVEKHEIPKNAIDPWTQEKILKTIEKNGSSEGGYVGWQ